MHIFRSYIQEWMMMKTWKMTKVLLKVMLQSLSFIAMIFLS